MKENKAIFLWLSFQLSGNVFLSCLILASASDPLSTNVLSISLRRFLSLFKPASVFVSRGSQVCCRRLCVGLASAFPGYRPVSLLPERDPVTGTNLFGVLEEACRSGDDPTGQPTKERRDRKMKRRCATIKQNQLLKTSHLMVVI